METIGKYEILDKIGSGGFAVVYKGYDPFIKRPVAVKVCYSRDEETRRRFHREAEIAGRLVHRNITTVYDFGLQEDMPYLVEEYLSGEDLAHLIRRQEDIHLDEKLSYLHQIGDGLGYAHGQGVVHRDIKPSNIRVLDSGRIKIMDFGTAKLTGTDSNLTQTGMTMGTIAYLAPERLRGHSATPASDLFSLGVLAYELLALRRPFDDSNIPALIDRVLNEEPAPLVERAPSCPPELAQVIERCLIKDPGQRWRSCAELVDAMGAARPPLTVASRADTPAGDAGMLAGLLDRARRNLARDRRQRAQILLEEAAEIDPSSTEVQTLLAACRAGDAPSGGPPAAPLTADAPVAENPASPSVSASSTAVPVPVAPIPPPPPPPTAPAAEAIAEEDDEARRREAMRSIGNLVEDGRWAGVADALRFAVHLFGHFEGELTALKRSIATGLRHSVDEVRAGGLAQAQQIETVLGDLVGHGAISRDLAEHFVESAEELAPGNDRARATLQALGNRISGTMGGQARQRADAIASIERLLDDAQPGMADEALRFARRLFGDFEEAASLRQRIDAALDAGDGTS